jgi:hypothetical protein
MATAKTNSKLGPKVFFVLAASYGSPSLLGRRDGDQPKKTKIKYVHTSLLYMVCGTAITFNKLFHTYKK